MGYYMKIIWIVIVSLALIAGCKTGTGSDTSGGSGIDGRIPEAGEEDYTASDYASVFKMWEEFQYAFTDAEKDRDGDSEMCWAATAANTIAWAG
jgi:hypothetical protein